MNSFRGIANKMDSVQTPNSMRTLIKMHRWAPSQTKGFRNIVFRHTNANRLERRFLAMNTYLMDVPIGAGAKPAAIHRAKELGKVLKRNHDIALLAEIFEHNIEGRVLLAWPASAQPPIVSDAQDFSTASSGLVIISQKDKLVGKELHEYKNEQGSDAWANKGVLLTTIDVGLGRSKLELYNTHLNFAGGAMGARKFQLLELMGFIERMHNKNNIAILAGDFNFALTDKKSYFDDPKIYHQFKYDSRRNLVFTMVDTSFSRFIKQKLTGNEYPDGMTEYEVLTELLALFDFTDTWVTRNGTPGYTQNVHDKRIRKQICKPDANDPQLCNDLDVPSHPDDIDPGSSSRIDYIFISNPTDTQTFSLDFTRPRRARYERGPNAPLREDNMLRLPDGRDLIIEGIDMLSDHVGLSTTLMFSPANA